MRQSYYNFIYHNILNDTNDSVIYNARTGALAVIEREKLSAIDRFKDGDEEAIDKDFQNQLEECGFVIADTYDEKATIKFNMLRSRFNAANLFLTIAPTMACNFRCIYCFEKGQYRNEIMSDETLNMTLEFIKNQISHIEHLNIAWYGGEPLLAIKQIESLSEKILNMCRINNVEYTSTIITNGYLLDCNIANTLKNCGIKNIQITIDGPKDIHDIRRPLLNGRGTFDVIMDNILKTYGILPIIVRVNTDLENKDSISDITSFLKSHSLMKHVTVYLGHILPGNDSYEGSKCMTDEVYSKFNLKFMVDNSIPLGYIYPSPKTNYCAADHVNGYVIDADGRLYKCWSDIGRSDRSIGMLGQEKIAFEKAYKYLLYDPTIDEQCSECKYLPVCMGSCPFNRVSNFSVCTQQKYTLGEYLKECANIMLAQREESVSI
jgi:uncharacterized protein